MQAQITKLNAWVSKPGYNGAESSYFVKLDPVTVSCFKAWRHFTCTCSFCQVSGGMFTAHLLPDTILTLSTSTGQNKGSYDNIPVSKPFPIPYMDDFESNIIMMVICRSHRVDRL